MRLYARHVFNISISLRWLLSGDSIFLLHKFWIPLRTCFKFLYYDKIRNCSVARLHTYIPTNLNIEGTNHQTSRRTSKPRKGNTYVLYLILKVRAYLPQVININFNKRNIRICHTNTQKLRIYNILKLFFYFSSISHPNFNLKIGFHNHRFQGFFVNISNAKKG